jgi:LAO/AO transport system kinase
VIEAPGLGDDVQAIKAGILEIADVLVVNKADRAGATNTVRALRAMLELGHPTAPTQSMSHHGHMMQVSAPADMPPTALWIPPIVETISTKEAHDPESGITALLEAIESHRAYLESAGNREALMRDRVHFELMERLRHELVARLLRDVPSDVFDAVIERVAARQLDPQSAVDAIIDAQHTPKR